MGTPACAGVGRKFREFRQPPCFHARLLSLSTNTCSLVLSIKARTQYTGIRTMYSSANNYLRDFVTSKTPFSPLFRGDEVFIFKLQNRFRGGSLLWEVRSLGSLDLCEGASKDGGACLLDLPVHNVKRGTQIPEPNKRARADERSR